MPVTYRGEVDSLLSGISIQYAQDTTKYVAERVFPAYDVQYKSDEYLVYPRGWFLRSQVQERPLGGEPPEATYGLTSATYSAKEYALAATLDDRERANARPPHDPEDTHIRFLTDNHLIFREIKWAQAFFRTGVWGKDLTGQATAPAAGLQTSATAIMQWDQANSNPQMAVDELKEFMGLTTGNEGNVLVLGRSAYTRLKSHPSIIDRTKYTSSDAVTKDILAAYFEVDEVIVPQAVVNVAPELAPQLGDNVNLNWIINPKGMLLLYRNPVVGAKMLTGGLTFRWSGLLNAGGFTLPVFRDRKTRAFSDWFAVRQAFDMRVVAPDAGVFVGNIVA